VESAIIVGFGFIASAVAGIAGVIPRTGLRYLFFLGISAIDAKRILIILLQMFKAN